ncbi:MAG: hypothetical protein QM308_08160 [Bacillota bacterium]|nr:hypothetical protein [Bacillota bacterium]
MRCACPNCGDLMPQADDALKCVCPNCGHVCDACLGKSSAPMSLEMIRKLAEAGVFDKDADQEQK